MLGDIIINHKKETIMKKITIIITTICIISTILYATDYIIKITDKPLFGVEAPYDGTQSQKYTYEGQLYIDNPEPTADILLQVKNCDIEFPNSTSDLNYNDKEEGVTDLHKKGYQKFTVSKKSGSVNKENVEAIFKLQKYSDNNWVSHTITFAAKIEEEAN